MNLIVDAGNTVVKAAVCDGLTIGKTFRYQGENRLEYVKILADEVLPRVLVYCCANILGEEQVNMLEQCAPRVVILDPSRKAAFQDMSIPDYLTPDALASVKAALHMFRGKAFSIFDFGTIITSTFIDEKGAFLGSCISPGCTTRFRSISRYARNLPLLREPENVPRSGTGLESSIQCGVVSGIMFEIEGYISSYPQNIAIFTGGDANYFAKRTKNSIFVVCNLVLMGLALIAQQNEID